MARIVGNLLPEDDYTHPLGPEPNFNESMYFNFFDPERGLGGFVRLGNRANEGRAEKTVALYRPDGRALFHFERATIDSNDAFDAGGLRFEVVKPTDELRTLYDGPVLDLADPLALADPRRAFRESPKQRVAIDLVHTAVGPMYGSRGSDDEAELPADQQFAKAHYEQHMRVEGTLELDGERVVVAGFGLRDHSWGPRYWQAIHGYEWLTLNFGEDFGAMLSRVRREPGMEKVGGVVVRGDELVPVKAATLEVDYAPDGLAHRALDVTLETESETLRIHGEVRGFLPLRNRRDGLVTQIGEGMTEWTCGDRTGYGLSELLRQVE